jgi:AmiR/NasT family two-component response regulator
MAILMATNLENIVELLGPREVIGQAIDLLMARHDVSRDAAFAMLVHGSSGSRRKVRDVATEVVQRRDLESA